jgi:hypothetical protein
MKSSVKTFALLAAAFLVAIPAMAQSANRISGNYMEFRNADVYTGPCFANSQVGLTGQNAVLAWQITDGQWNGVSLSGLGVVAVVRASATLGDPFADPLPAKTVLFVDSRASEAQQAALISFAQSQSARLLNDIVATSQAPISFSAAPGRMAWQTLSVGDVVKLSTRAITMNDMICHNEQTYYPPLSSHLTHSMAVVALDSSYQGNSLGVTWDESNGRGSFVGKFAE